MVFERNLQHSLILRKSFSLSFQICSSLRLKKVCWDYIVELKFKKKSNHMLIPDHTFINFGEIVRPPCLFRTTLLFGPLEYLCNNLVLCKILVDIIEGIPICNYVVMYAILSTKWCSILLWCKFSEASSRIKWCRLRHDYLTPYDVTFFKALKVCKRRISNRAQL